MKKLSELPAALALDGGDLFYVVDITLGDAGSSKITLTELTAEIMSAFTLADLSTTQTDVVLGRETAGAGAIEEITCTAFARSVLDDADAATARNTLGLGTIATQADSAVAITGGSIVGITDLTIADGGTGASTAAAARTALGIVLGTDVQTYDALLLAIAGLVTAADDMIYATGVDTVDVTTLTTFARTLLDDATAAAALTTLGAVGSVSNQGSGGIGVYKQKTGTDIELRNINESTGISVTLDVGNNEIDIAIDISSLTAINTPDTTNDYVAIYDATDGGIKKISPGNLSAGGAGETNTVSNVGVGGLGIYKQKAGVDFELYNIVGGFGIGATLDAVNDEIDIDLDINSLAEVTSADETADYVAIFDATDSGIKKLLIGSFSTARRWSIISAANYTATPSTTSRLLMSDTSDFISGSGTSNQPIKWVDGNGTHYAIVSAVVENTHIDIYGAPFTVGSGADLTVLYIGNAELVHQVDFNIGGAYGDGAETDLLWNDVNTQFIWELPPAALVHVKGLNKTDDGTAQPYINIQIDDDRVLTESSGKGIQPTTTWVRCSAVGIDIDYYTASPGSSVEVECAQAGSDGDAANLTISLIFVLL